MSAIEAAQIYQVRQHYWYEYTAPITAVRQQLIMVPPDRHGDQILRSFTFDVRGTAVPASIDWQTDRFGNRVCRVAADRVEHALDFLADYQVQRSPGSGDSAELGADAVRPYFAFTGLTASDERLIAAAREIAAGTSDPFAQAEAALQWSARAITYHFGITGTQTPAALALHLGEGVCQDYAHIMLSVLRGMGIAARYVSGHLLGHGAPHAWVEALPRDPATGRHAVIGYDPTHSRRANEDYIVVAAGRDFSDVTPTSGVFTGAATGRLHWSKVAERVEDNVDREKFAA